MLRLTIPAPEKSLATSAVERRGSNGPAPRPCISMGAKATNTRRGITPTTIQLIHRQRQEDERLWRLLQQRTTFLFGRNTRWRRSRWSLGRRACQKGQLDLVDSCRGCWRCPCWMSGRWRLSLYRVHTKCWLEKPAVAVQTNAQQIHPDVTNSDHH